METRTATGTRRMTVAQAVVEYLSKQYTVDRIGTEDFRERLIPGTFGIFGHGNVAGIGQALKQYQQLDPAIMPYYQGRNEQAQAHQAVRSEERRVGKECSSRW